jgi:hypothetical protein
MQEQAMAQETAASMTAPEGAIWQAWLDALIHPKFETYARWFPLMKSRWRNISLAVSLMLIILNIYAHGALDVFTVSHKSQALAFGNMVAYFSSPRGLYFIFFYGPCSVLLLYLIPGIVALASSRDFGPYGIRFKRVFRPWMQIQPTICVLLLYSTVSQLVLKLVGIYDSEFILFSLLTFLLVSAPALVTWSYSIVALSAGSSLSQAKAGWVGAIPGILLYGLYWFWLPGVFISLGHPVL